MTQLSTPTLLGSLAPISARPLHAVFAVLGGVALITLSSRIQVPMWPVPMTMQTLAVLLVVMSMGARLGTATVASYLGAGAVGLPVFAAGGGLVYLTGPTAGYLLGFLLVAVIVGGLADRGLTRHPLGSFALAVLGGGLIYLAGASWLAVFIGVEAAITAGVLPFLPGDLVKSVLLAMMLHGGWKFLQRRG